MGDKMKRAILGVCLFILGVVIFPQQISEQSQVINVEIPVRVFDGNVFVDNLTIQDFEIYQDGIRQNVEALYLIKKRAVERSEEKKRFAPETSRHFFLFFEISEYYPRLSDAIDYFIQNVIIPGDNLIIVTPLKTYRQTYRALQLNSREELARQLKELLRRDTLIGYSEYRRSLDDLSSLTLSLASDNERPSDVERNQPLSPSTTSEFSFYFFEAKLMRYMDIIERIESLRRVDQQKLLGFADYLKEVQGQKYIYFIYQKEYVPRIERNILMKYMELYQDRPNVVNQLKKLMEMYRREITFDVDLVKKSYADSSISIHFLFLTPPPDVEYGLEFHEQSEDIFSAFREISFATGGYMDSSENPTHLFNGAVEASENFYLLYYSPKDYVEDGEFHNIEVRIKDKKYKVVHRMGYFAK